jgi:glycosyltransferase involved in cell wall biosynthesis
VTSKKRTNIAFFISNFEAGGAETQFWNLARGLDRTQYNVHIIQIESKGRTAVARELNQTSFITIKARFHLDPIAVFRICRYLSTQRIDILQSILFMDNQFARVSGFFLGLPVVTSVRGDLKPILGNLKTQIEYAMQTLSSAVVTNSNWLKQELIKGGSKKNKVHVIYNGINTENLYAIQGREAIRQQLAIAEDCRLVGIVGRFHPMKDHDTFLNALQLLVSDDERVKGVLIGGGPDEARLKQQVQDMGLAPHVIFAGVIKDDIGSWYRALDLLFLTSKWGESFPNVILEAMSCGLPVVSTDVSAVNEIIDQSVNGFMAPIGDADALVDRARMLLNNKDLRDSVVSKAEQTIKALDTETMVSKFSALYQTLL